MRELLANRRLLVFWFGQSVSRVGDGMAPIAAAALALRYYGIGGLGAVLAGVLVATVGPRWTYAVDAGTFAVSVATLLVVRLPRLPGGAAGVGLLGALRDARDGLRAVLAQPWAAVVMAQGTVQVLAGFAPVQVLLPVVAIGRYGIGAYGVLAAAQGIGSMLGGLVALRLRPRREGITAMHGVALFGPVCVCLAVPVPRWVFLICQATAWAGIAVFLALWFSSLQREFPRVVHGRVLSLEALITFALQPVGLALAPLAAARFGVPAVGVSAAVVVVASSYAVLLVRGVPTFTAQSSTSLPEAPPGPVASVPGSAVDGGLS